MRAFQCFQLSAGMPMATTVILTLLITGPAHSDLCGQGDDSDCHLGDFSGEGNVAPPVEQPHHPELAGVRELLALIRENNDPDPFQILGVDRTTSQGAIRAAYRGLSLRWHPDRNTNSEVAGVIFQAVSKAYALIGDPDRRAMYEDFGEDHGGFGSAQEYFASHKQSKNDLYSGDELITQLTLDLFNKRVVGSEIWWMIDFYAPWCSHCQRLTPEWKRAAEELDRVVEFGAVNCVKEMELCSQFGVHQYPSLRLYLPRMEMQQEYPIQNGATTDAITSWARAKMEELEWVRVHANVSIVTHDNFASHIGETKWFCAILFLPSLKCNSCQFAIANFFRLSAGLHGLNVVVGMVDCSDRKEGGGRALCEAQGISHLNDPRLQGFATGSLKVIGGGEDLLQGTEGMGMHHALRLVERIMRLTLTAEAEEGTLMSGAHPPDWSAPPERPPPPPPSDYSGAQQRQQYVQLPTAKSRPQLPAS